VEEDDKGRIPFIEPIVLWIEARRAVRKWKVDTDRTRQKVALVAAKLHRKMGSRATTFTSNSDSDSEDSFTKPKRIIRKRTTVMGSEMLGSFLGKHDEKQARMELEIIVDSADDAMFCIDEKGHILLSNHAAQKQFGYSKKEFSGSNISMICNANDASRHGEYLKRYLRTREKRVMGKKRELLARRKDGSTFFIELGLTEVNMGAGKFIFCGFVKDLTNLKQH